MNFSEQPKKPNWSSAEVPPEFKDGKEFSKANFSERRNELAGEIRSKRTSYFHQKEKEKDRAYEKLPQQEQEKLSILEDIQRTRDSIERTAKKLRVSILEKIIGENAQRAKRREFYTDDQKMNNESLQDLTTKLHTCEEDIRWLQATINGTVQTMDLARVANNAQNKLTFEYSFYQREHTAHEDTREKDIRYDLQLLEEAPTRTIEHFAEKENIFFVHGTHPSFDPSENSPLIDGLGWQQKIKIAIGLEPLLSTSSLREGFHTYENMFAGVGLVLGGGRIDYISLGDANTKPVSDTERLVPGSWGAQREYDKKRDTPTHELISYIVKTGPKGKQDMKHNEILIQSPKGVALYLSLDDITDPIDAEAYKLPAHTEIKELSEELGLPVLGFKDGKCYQVSLDSDIDQYSIDSNQEISPQDILNLQGVSEEKRSELVQSIQNERNSLFKSKTP